MENCQHSLKSTFKKVKIQIQKGANPEKAARRGYDTACDYSEVLNKTILIQQRALACLSKSLGHIFQRELCSMGNTGLLRRSYNHTLGETSGAEEFTFLALFIVQVSASKGGKRLPPQKRHL